MKIFILFSLIFISNIGLALENLEHAYEVEKVHAEYFDISKTGIIRPIICSNCPEKVITFDNSTQFFHKSNAISAEQFVLLHRKEKFFTIFYDIKTNKLTRIKF